jgi:tetratricopeptide (TPR) repeat protein
MQRILYDGDMRGLALLLGAAVCLAQDWRVPDVNSAELLIVIEQSKRSYTIVLGTKLWKDAQGPERIPIADRGAVERCTKLIDGGQFAEAESAVQAMLAKNQADWDAYYLRALALHKQGKKEEARLALRESLIGNRRNPDAWALLKKIVVWRTKRPVFEMRAWVRERGKEVEIAYNGKSDADFPWLSYGIARAYYRYEGGYRRDFGRAKYRFTFREELLGLGAAVSGARSAKKDRERIPKDLKRLLDLQKKKELVPFAFFAIYPEPIPRGPERGFDRLKPQLERYFDRNICRKR